MKIVAMCLALVACGGVAPEPQDADMADAGPSSDAQVEADAAWGRLCMTDPINGAGYYVDGGCEPGSPCPTEDGGAGKCF